MERKLSVDVDIYICMYIYIVILKSIEYGIFKDDPYIYVYTVHTYTYPYTSLILLDLGFVFGKKVDPQAIVTWSGCVRLQGDVRPSKEMELWIHGD